jgi:hypothetical protein
MRILGFGPLVSTPTLAAIGFPTAPTRKFSSEFHRTSCLDLLEATPGILRGLMAELTEEDARCKPAPERFSVAEVLTHLSH